ncbi:hypothetical protein BJ138DRAFT_1195241 [Hygrophoropsis aurantiaca]|uniref:Uncharacterized protein n=1 Tax=Hygrophoropsis aurantiaca TaxID=72124 RepID=A0ACB7ZQ28_9AGAM|nr:hypothetical protein BJ138DRAFT_1195241 [Hygrophoropsis aurantiaca]
MEWEELCTFLEAFVPRDRVVQGHITTHRSLLICFAQAFVGRLRWNGLPEQKAGRNAERRSFRDWGQTLQIFHAKCCEASTNGKLPTQRWKRRRRRAVPVASSSAPPILVVPDPRKNCNKSRESQPIVPSPAPDNAETRPPPTQAASPHNKLTVDHADARRQIANYFTSLHATQTPTHKYHSGPKNIEMDPPLSAQCRSWNPCTRPQHQSQSKVVNVAAGHLNQRLSASSNKWTDKIDWLDYIQCFMSSPTIITGGTSLWDCSMDLGVTEGVVRFRGPKVLVMRDKLPTSSNPDLALVKHQTPIEKSMPTYGGSYESDCITRP